jgi:hypothetical protein
MAEVIDNLPKLLCSINDKGIEASKTWEKTEDKNKQDVQTHWSLWVISKIIEHSPLTDRIEICNKSLESCLFSEDNQA